MGARIERILLYLAVLGLAIAFGLLALKITIKPGDAQEPEGPAGECVQTAAGVDLAGIDATVAKTVEDSLAGLDERVADTVADRLLAGTRRPTGAGGECEAPTPQLPCPRSTGGGNQTPTIAVSSKFTFLYENARLNENGEVDEDSFGVRLARRHLKRLELITNAFRPCHRPTAPVEFVVSGYSSTAEFLTQPDGKPLANSDSLNVTTANRRAQIVGGYLQDQGFSVETRQWSSSDDLQRPYLDDAQPGMDQQALNRTVFIELLRAGACDLAR